MDEKYIEILLNELKDAEMREKGLRAGIQNIADSLGVGDEPRFKWIDIEISDMKTTIDKLCDALEEAANDIFHWSRAFDSSAIKNKAMQGSCEQYRAIVKEVRGE